MSCFLYGGRHVDRAVFFKRLYNTVGLHLYRSLLTRRENAGTVSKQVKNWKIQYLIILKMAILKFK